MASKKVDVATALGSLDLGGGAVEKKTVTPKVKAKKDTVKSSILLNFADSETKENLKVLADIKGCSMTEYVLALITEDIKNNDSLIKQVKKLREKANN